MGLLKFFDRFPHKSQSVEGGSETIIEYITDEVVVYIEDEDEIIVYMDDG